MLFVPALVLGLIPVWVRALLRLLARRLFLFLLLLWLLLLRFLGPSFDFVGSVLERFGQGFALFVGLLADGLPLPRGVEVLGDAPARFRIVDRVAGGRAVLLVERLAQSLDFGLVGTAGIFRVAPGIEPFGELAKLAGDVIAFRARQLVRALQELV